MSNSESGLRLDEIGTWSEIKLAIIREYAKAYSTILAKQPFLYHMYIDGFAGAGMHKSKSTGQTIAGSPINVTSIEPRFREYHFVELDPSKAEHLRKLFATQPEVRIHEGDCNYIVARELMPMVRFDKYRRALCLLDPYGLDLEWDVICAAGEQGTVDLLLNFPMMDMNRNVLWHDSSAVSPDQRARMTRYWGDVSWMQAAYVSEPGLFGSMEEKTGNEAVALAFAERLHKVAKFKHVAKPLAMKNSTNAIVYYLFFATSNSTAHKIIGQMFQKRNS